MDHDLPITHLWRAAKPPHDGFSAPNRLAPASIDRSGGPSEAVDSESQACCESIGQEPIRTYAAVNPTTNGQKPKRGRDVRAAFVRREEEGAPGFARLRRLAQR